MDLTGILTRLDVLPGTLDALLLGLPRRTGAFDRPRAAGRSSRSSTTSSVRRRTTSACGFGRCSRTPLGSGRRSIPRLVVAAATRNATPPRASHAFARNARAASRGFDRCRTPPGRTPTSSPRGDRPRRRPPRGLAGPRRAPPRADRTAPPRAGRAGRCALLGPVRGLSRKDGVPHRAVGATPRSAPPPRRLAPSSGLRYGGPHGCGAGERHVSSGAIPADLAAPDRDGAQLAGGGRADGRQRAAVAGDRGSGRPVRAQPARDAACVERVRDLHAAPGALSLPRRPRLHDDLEEHAINIELPLKAFFFLVPILFLITHAYTLAHYVLLADKAKRFHLLLREQVKGPGDKPDSEQDEKAANIRTGLQRQLPSDIFVQFSRARTTFVRVGLASFSK